MSTSDAGRSCPLHYRYSPEAFAIPAENSCDILYIVGGLYGNELALEQVLKLFEAEGGDKRLVFNGDFNWFNVDPEAFERLNRTVLSFQATRGNVETELVRISGGKEDSADAGCGCAYPDWVDDSVVQWSNIIMRRLQDTASAFPELTAQLQALPMWRRMDIGGQRVAIVHGDAQSLSGWGFAQEMLIDPAHLSIVAEWFTKAKVDVFACSHTCLPVFYRGTDPHSTTHPIVLNNGAAGMSNFTGVPYGLITRIGTTPYSGPERVFGFRHGFLYMDALALHFNVPSWQAQFLANWPPESAAYRSYWSRIQNGPTFTQAQAVLDCLSQPSAH